MAEGQLQRNWTEDPLASLEKGFMEEYLGRSLASLAELPEEEAHLLRTHASSYASAKLAEIGARAHVSQVLGAEHRSTL